MTLKLYRIQLSQLPLSLLIALLCASWTVLPFHSFVHNPRVAAVCCLILKSDPPFKVRSDFPLVKVEYIHLYFVLSQLFLYLSRISGVQTIVYSSYHFNFEHNAVYLVAFNKFVLIKVLFYSVYEDVLDRLIISYQVLLKN